MYKYTNDTDSVFFHSYVIFVCVYASLLCSFSKLLLYTGTPGRIRPIEMDISFFLFHFFVDGYALCYVEFCNRLTYL